VCVKWHSVLEGHRKIGKLIIPHTKRETGVNEPPRHLFAKAPRKSVHQDAAKITEPKLNDTQCGFRCCRSTTEQISTFYQIFEKSWEYSKDVYTYFVAKVYGGVPREKLLGVLQEYSVNGCLFLAVK